jgi:hypothetical protein
MTMMDQDDSQKQQPQDRACENHRTPSIQCSNERASSNHDTSTPYTNDCHDQTDGHLDIGETRKQSYIVGLFTKHIGSTLKLFGLGGQADQLLASSINRLCQLSNAPNKTRQANTHIPRLPRMISTFRSTLAWSLRILSAPGLAEKYS